MPVETGFYSAGRRLIDGSPDNASAIMATDMPEYVCDGAHTRSDAYVLDRCDAINMALTWSMGCTCTAGIDDVVGRIDREGWLKVLHRIYRVVRPLRRGRLAGAWQGPRRPSSGS